MKNIVKNPFVVGSVAVLLLMLAFSASNQFQQTGTILPPDKNTAKFSLAPSPLDKVMKLEQLASANGGFPTEDWGDEIVGVMYTWSRPMTTLETNLNIVSAGPWAVESGQQLHRTPNEFWIKDGVLGPNDEYLIHAQTEAVLIPGGVEIDKGTPIEVKRHQSGFLYGTPAPLEEKVAYN